jgi:hypothetical protein
MSAVSIATRGIICTGKCIGNVTREAVKPTLSVVELKPAMVAGVELKPEIITAEDQDQENK